MNSFDPDKLSRSRARRNAAAVNRGKTGNSYGSGYVRDSLRQCPKHHVDYVLRRSTRESPALLICYLADNLPGRPIVGMVQLLVRNRHVVIAV